MKDFRLDFHDSELGFGGPLSRRHVIVATVAVASLSLHISLEALTNEALSSEKCYPAKATKQREYSTFPPRPVFKFGVSVHKHNIVYRCIKLF